ncbi:T9SS type A sorting domain-containing protein [Flavobacteriaceae bacterium]|nr:T9SS type A sorting domain-containing protein [Flavobacteriaceae bacterium]
MGLKLQDGLTTTYPGNAVTISDSDWHYYVYLAELQVGDQVNPRLIPQGSGTFYIDDANFSEGFGDANVEWDNINGVATTYSDFWITQDYGGTTNGTLSKNTNTINVKSGYNSLRLVTNADASNLKRGVLLLKNNENYGNRYEHPAATRKYQVAAWVYATNAADIVLNVKAGSNNTTDHSISANTWTQIVSDIIELDRGDFGTKVYPKIEFKTPSTIHYIDDIYLNWGGNTWNGSTSSDWHTASNWTPNIVPGENAQISIPKNLSNYPTASSDVAVGTVNMAAGSSLIAQSTFSGNITYNRDLDSTNWYLISSPVVGQDIDAFVSNSNLAAASGNNNIGLGDYNNATSGWTYYQSGSSDSGNFTSGDGSAIKLASTGELSFTGTIDVNDSGVAIGITTNFDGYNLIGNPYPSYIAANNSADGTNNILKVNDTDNDYLTEATLWFWNQSTSSYDQINHASSATYIAPAQGFFVSANGSHSFRFTEDMQSHQSSDSFQRPSARQEIKLILNNGSDTRNADIFFIDGTTTGWDNGYDSTIFRGDVSDFQIYTHLVSNSQKQDLGIQSLPNNNFENMVIPVGINAVSGSYLTIDAITTNFPLGMRVYLEDKVDNSFTRLDSDSNFSITLKNNLQGIGRFYLHTTTASLSAPNESINTPISIYLSSRENLRVVGVQNETANVYVYNMIGKEVLRSSFEGQGINDIQLPKLSEAVYIVKISTLNGTVNKKIIIR